MDGKWRHIWVMVIMELLTWTSKIPVSMSRRRMGTRD
jgi:hypothetical protein